MKIRNRLHKKIFLLISLFCVVLLLLGVLSISLHSWEIITEYRDDFETYDMVIYWPYLGKWTPAKHYSIEIASEETIKVNLKVPPTADYDIALIYESELEKGIFTLLIYSSNGPGVDEEFIYTVSRSAIYAILVYSIQGTNTYTLQISKPSILGWVAGGAFLGIAMIILVDTWILNARISRKILKEELFGNTTY